MHISADCVSFSCFFFFFVVVAAQVFRTALLTGPSVRAEAGQNLTAGTFTF